MLQRKRSYKFHPRWGANLAAFASCCEPFPVERCGCLAVANVQILHDPAIGDRIDIGRRTAPENRLNS